MRHAAVPETQAFLQAAFARGENAGSTTLKPLRLLDDYGDKALSATLTEALERDTPRISSRGTRTPFLALSTGNLPPS